MNRKCEKIGGTEMGAIRRRGEAVAGWFGVKAAFASGFMEEIGQLTTFCRPQAWVGYPHRNEMEALRGDMRRLGKDMAGVMRRHAWKE